MTGGDEREPLWASSLAHQPRRELEPAHREPETPVQAPPPPRAAPGRRAVALGALGAIVMVALAMALAGRSSIVVEDVPSSWDDVLMTCRTTRLEQGDRALEWFSCRAIDGGRLPPGVYRSPDARWTSDLTRRDARTNVIEISPDGRLTGWAAYF